MSAAQPCEGWVWCDECEEPHAADFDATPPTLMDGDPDGAPCQALQPVERVKALPADWERTFHAQYAEPIQDGYDLWLKAPPLTACHHPMYYLADLSAVLVP